MERRGIRRAKVKLIKKLKFWRRKSIESNHYNKIVGCTIMAHRLNDWTYIAFLNRRITSLLKQKHYGKV